MASKFNKNCIFTGVADSFCLSCQIYLKVKDLNNHIESSKHQDTLKSVGYAEKYKDNLIWKVTQGYYCELCNVVIQTIVKVCIHVSDQTHINNKTQRHIKGHEEGVIVFNEIFIEMKAWNGLSNESCFICNTDFDNEENHKNDTKHIKNLIQSKLELKEDKTVYRKIDDNLVNCLICNVIVHLESKEAHIKTSKHLKEYSKCKENIKKINFYEDAFITPSDTKDENSKKSVIETNLESVVVQNEKNINKTELKMADSNNIKEKPVENTEIYIAKVTNATDAKDNENVLLPCEALKLAMDFAKQNHLKYKRNSTYCQVCNVRISSSLKMMKEHVSENGHKKNIEKMEMSKQKKSKKPMIEFIDSKTDIENIFHEDVVINDEFCMTNLSFNMIGGSGRALRCHACEVSILPSHIEAHKRTYKHNDAMLVTPVLIEFKNEFIREVRSGIFHCGYCNFIEASLDGMQNHLKSIDHSEKKSHCRVHLNRYLPQIMEEREKKKFLAFMRMIHNGFYGL